MLRELTVGGGWAMKRDEDQLWKGRINIWTTNRWLADKLRLVRKDDPNAVIQVYNMAGGGSGEGGTQAARLFYGFFNWKARKPPARRSGATIIPARRERTTPGRPRTRRRATCRRSDGRPRAKAPRIGATWPRWRNCWRRASRPAT